MLRRALENKWVTLPALLVCGLLVPVFTYYACDKPEPPDHPCRHCSFNFTTGVLSGPVLKNSEGSGCPTSPTDYAIDQFDAEALGGVQHGKHFTFSPSGSYNGGQKIMSEAVQTTNGLQPLPSGWTAMRLRVHEASGQHRTCTMTFSNPAF